MPARWRDLAPLVWATHFVDTVTPAAGLGGSALLLRDARRRGLEMGWVTLADTLYFLFNFVWFVLLLGVSLVALIFWHDLKPYEIVAAMIPMAGIIVALFALWLVGARPPSFSRLAVGLGNRVNALSRRVVRREWLQERSALEFADNFALAAATLRTARGCLWRPWLHAMLVAGIEIAVLGACFAAFPALGAKSRR